MSRAANVCAAACLSLASAARGADLSQLAFLAGSWQGEENGVLVEERWMEPRAGCMLGVNRTTKGDRLLEFEFLRLEAGADGVAYLASPAGRPETRFALVEASEKRAVFENRQHDFPRRILYWLHGDGRLHARIEGARDGKPASMEWTWSRVATK